MIKKFLWLFFVFALCLCFTGTARAKLVTYYPFDGDVNDYSGNGKHGVYWSAGSSTTTPTFVTGANGQAISLQAFDSYDTAGVGGTRIYQGVVLPDESYFDFANEITLSLWCKFNSPMIVIGTDGQHQGAWAALMQRSRTSGHWCLQTNWNTTSPAQRLSFRIAHPATTTSTMSVRPGTTDVAKHLSMDPSDWVTPNWDLWYHVVTTYDSTGLATIYLDSAFNRSQQDTGTDHSIVDKGDGGYNLAVGIGVYANSDYTPGGTGTSSDYSHDGLIDEVAIFDHVLSPRAIEMLYQNGSLCLIDETQNSTEVNEKGIIVPATDEYKILFMRQPASPVTITVGGYDTDQISVDPETMVVSSLPWEYTLTVTAVDDPAIEGFQTTNIAHTVTSADSRFNWGHDANYLPDVVVNIYDEGSLVLNSGFELPNVEDSPPYWMANPDNWQISGDGGIRQWKILSENGQVAFAFKNSEFRQDTTAAYLANTTYNLTVDIGLPNDSCPADYAIQLRDTETDTVWAEATQADFGHPTPGFFNLTPTLSYTAPAAGGPVGQGIRICLILEGMGENFDNVKLLSVTDPVTLTVAVEPNDQGIDTVSPALSQTIFQRDANAVIKADTFTNGSVTYYFDHWSGEGIKNPDNSRTAVTLDQSKTVTAVYTTSPMGVFLSSDLSRDGSVDLADWPYIADNWRGSGGLLTVQTNVTMTADQGAVSCLGPLPALTGMEILRKGGNAVDAMVAAILTATVVNQQSNGMGSYGGAMVIYLKELGQPVVVDFNTRAPLAATFESLSSQPSGTSILSTAIWNMAAGLYVAQEEYGTMSWQEVIQPAIRYADEGFIMSARFAGVLGGSYESKIKYWPAGYEIFTRPGGGAWRAGDRLVQKDLANTLRLLADEGADAIYTGKVGQRMVNYIQSIGGIITMDDMADWRQRSVRILTPAHTNYRGYDIYTSPICSGGENVIEILNILKGFDLAGLGYSAQSMHLILEATRLGFADRLEYIGDPWMSAVPYAGIMSQGYADERRQLIDPNVAMPSRTAGNPWPYDPYYAGQTVDPQPSPDMLLEPGDTQHSSLMDRNGNMVSLTATLSGAWGNGITIPGVGIVLNNGMSKFVYGTAYADHPNRVDGGKLALNNMNPIIVMKDGRPYFTAGAEGGTHVMTACVNVIINVIDWGRNLQDALNAPRYYVVVNTCELESGTPSSIISELEQMGHPCVIGGGGQVHSVMLDPVSGKHIAAYERRNADSSTGGFIQDD